MNTKDFNKLHEFAIGEDYNVFPVNYTAVEAVHGTPKGDSIYYKKVEARDILKHKMFFAMLKYIYNLLPGGFRVHVPEKYFLNYIQYGMGDFKPMFKTKSSVLVPVFNSISFGNMGNEKFKEYVRSLLPFIYANIVLSYFEIGEVEKIKIQIESKFSELIKTI